MSLFFLPVLFGAGSSAQSSQQSKRSEERGQAFSRIEFEDAIEAGLIEQQLKIKPEMVLARAFYLYTMKRRSKYCAGIRTSLSA